MARMSVQKAMTSLVILEDPKSIKVVCDRGKPFKSLKKTLFSHGVNGMIFLNVNMLHNMGSTLNRHGIICMNRVNSSRL